MRKNCEFGLNTMGPEGLTYCAILTTYNGQKTVISALESIINQTIKPSEIIIIDDCSIDQTPHLLKSVIPGLNNAKLILNTSNIGQSASRNLGALQSDSDILVFFDDDDVSSNLRAETHIELHANKSSLSFVSSKKVYPNGYNIESINHDVSDLRLVPKVWLEKLTNGKSRGIPNNLWVPASTSAISRVVFNSMNGYDESFRRLEDSELVIRCALKGLTASWSSEILVTRNATESSVKGGKIEMKFERQLLIKHQELMSAEELKKRIGLISIREAYFAKKFLTLVYLLIRNPGISFSSLRRIRGFVGRIIHDIRKSHE